MSFVQVEFLGFFLGVLVTYWLLGCRTHQNLLLLVASCVFYGWVHPWFVILLLGTATLDFATGWGMGRYPEHREKLLAVSVLGNLGILFWFKYRDFFVVNVALALESLGLQANPRVLGLLLPLGISFYTFQTLSYTVDIYRGVLRPRRSYLDYLTFVSFFPQLVAGPVERASRLLPQVEQARRFRWEHLGSGFGLALFGAFKKVVVADTLAPLVDQSFALTQPTGAMVWAGTVAFGVQMYADLSGYTDIARGTARMLGFELTQNFAEPFLATSTPDFWRRWHMSVSTWFRDYLLVPLLGSAPEVGRLRLASAVVVSFLIIGLWHGAGWNTLAFGLWHAVWVLLYLGLWQYAPAFTWQTRPGRAIAIVFHAVVVATPSGLLFREPSVSRALEKMVLPPWDGTPDDLVAAHAILVLCGLLQLPVLAHWAADKWVVPRLEAHPGPARLARVAVWALFAEAVFVFHRDTTGDFLYFQF